MKKLSKHGNPISINDAVLSLQGKNKIKSKSFVITLMMVFIIISQ